MPDHDSSPDDSPDDSPEAAATEPVEPTVEPAEPTPLLRIVKGDPTPEEVAALVSVVSALAAGAAQAATGTTTPPREWGAPHRKLRGTHRPGPGAWRATAR